MFRRRTCCVGDHSFRGRSAPYWSNMCWDHYAAGFFPPMDPKEIERLMAEPSPFELKRQAADEFVRRCRAEEDLADD